MPLTCVVTDAMKVVMEVTDLQQVLFSYHSLLAVNVAEDGVLQSHLIQLC